MIYKNPKWKYGQDEKFLDSYQRCFRDQLTNAIEGVQATQIAKTMKHGRAFSKEVGHKVIMLNVARYNQWEITTDLEEGGVNFSEIYEPHSDIVLHTRELKPSYKIPTAETGSVGIASILKNLVY
ncbi:hypothetical protein [Candidatus Mycoplasma mahonii]|uniref:hypothetical protein n=1 Tax=Candidatus Mycoplasma mahonii TaxID=3004105 RepID=UPI0026EAA162|nr:hypothetical protein [Candidatus Mycoplasma mahonii]WKX02681.1 hypothetical protein O3I44_01215 [Candidatus Mycoplasma mahonii]